MLQPANTSGLLRCACIRGLPPTVSAANVRRGSSVIGCASSGPEAIGLAERDLPDLVLIPHSPDGAAILRGSEAVLV